GKWTVKKHADSVEFIQELPDRGSGYSYVYRKVVRLIKGKPEMVIEHSLKNTSATKPIRSNMYNHNFWTLDNQPPGPGLSIEVPFELQPSREPNKELGEIRGNKIVSLKTLEGKDRMTASATGFSGSAKDYDFKVENRKAGAGVHITGDKPLANVNLWSIKTVM